MANTPWWGDFTFSVMQTHYWAAAERAIVIERMPSEWRTWNIEGSPESDAALLCDAGEPPVIKDDKSLGRHLQSATSEAIKVLPALADRPMVARPASALRVLAGEKVRLFVSTPLWFQASTLPSEVNLLDIPFWRPSDSWFGTSTREGELCYAKYTDARVQLELLAPRPLRAVTAINVINQHKEALVIERLNVPMPLLSVYADVDNSLWTEALTVTRKEDGDQAELELGKAPPDVAIEPVLVNKPRKESEKRTLIRSIGSLFA